MVLLLLLLAAVAQYRFLWRCRWDGPVGWCLYGGGGDVGDASGVGVAGAMTAGVMSAMLKVLQVVVAVVAVATAVALLVKVAVMVRVVMVMAWVG